MTEDEAKKKWCPHGRGLDSYSETVSHNRYTDGKPVTLCIGSECMAWRTIKGQVPVPADEVGSYKYVNANGGYCGLAGKP